jgi:colanic acid biosynthesis glycosyl transferase WcaI
VLVEAARHVKDPRVRIVICGEGATKEALVKRVAELGLKNVSMLPLQPEAEYHSMLVDADLCVITQQKGSGKYFFPSKLLTTLAYAKPVLTVADGESELSHAVATGKFGVSVEPGDAEKLGRELDRIAGSPAGLKELGEAGRRYVAQFDFPVVLKGFEDRLKALVAEKR